MRIDLNGHGFVAASAQIEACMRRFLDGIEQRLVSDTARVARTLRWRISHGASVRRPTESVDLIV